jgi:hypothetical protein
MLHDINCSLVQQSHVILNVPLFCNVGVVAQKSVFSLVSLRSETLEITSETKASEAKNQSKRNGTEKLLK